MKSAVRITHLKDGSKVLSLSVHMSKDELIAASETIRHDRNSTLPQIIQFAREETLEGFDLFLTFLRSLIHNIWLAKK